MGVLLKICECIDSSIEGCFWCSGMVDVKVNDDILLAQYQ